MSQYTHFTTEEREMSRGMRENGYSIRKIAEKLNRSPSSVSREFKRNSNKDGTYAAYTADKKYLKRRKNCCRKPKLLDENLKAYVLERLNLRWTPEEIAGRARLENAFSISYNTIYRAIDSGILPKSVKKIMRFKSKRNKKKKADDKRGKIPETVSISERPAEVEARQTVGHWEGDTVLGQRKTGCIGTLVERVTGYLVGFKLENSKAENFNKGAAKALSGLPKALKKTLTVDNGIEFMLHKELSKAIDMDIYFCDPYSPWQRGTNENTNGLLRQFFPKGSSFADITDEQLSDVVSLINNRPRKRLGFRSPAEVLYNFFTLFLLHLV